MHEVWRPTMVHRFILGAVCALACISTTLTAASAHVTLEAREAPVGASYKAVLRVPHGCDGTATTSIRVRIPEGIVAVKPMPKPGWTLDVVTGTYPKPFTVRGAKVTEGVTEVAWSGGKLPDAYYDEFVFAGAIGDELEAGRTIYFPVVQTCEKGVHRWIEIPAAAPHEGHGEGSSPAPGLKLLPKR
jgi:uncharacterized protein YcnI